MTTLVFWLDYSGYRIGPSSIRLGGHLIGLVDGKPNSAITHEIAVRFVGRASNANETILFQRADSFDDRAPASYARFFSDGCERRPAYLRPRVRMAREYIVDFGNSCRKEAHIFALDILVIDPVSRSLIPWPWCRHCHVHPG